MTHRIISIASVFSAVGCVGAVAAWMLAATGWQPRALDIDLVDVQAAPPLDFRVGVGSLKGLNPTTEASVRFARYTPLSDPEEGPPEEFRNDLYPMTSWVLHLSSASSKYGFGYSTIPVFDPSRARSDFAHAGDHRKPRLVGTYQEWYLPYWSLVLATALLPAARFIKERYAA